MQNNKYAQSNCTLRVVTTQGTAFCFAWIGLRVSYCGQRKHALDRRTVGRTRFQQRVLLLVPSNLCQAIRAKQDVPLSLNVTQKRDFFRTSKRLSFRQLQNVI